MSKDIQTSTWSWVQLRPCQLCQLYDMDEVGWKRHQSKILILSLLIFMLFDIWFLQLHCQVFHILASTRPESQTTMVCSLHDKNIMDGFIFGSRFRQKNFILTTSYQNTKNLDGLDSWLTESKTISGVLIMMSLWKTLTTIASCVWKESFFMKVNYTNNVYLKLKQGLVRFLSDFHNVPPLWLCGI